MTYADMLQAMMDRLAMEEQSKRAKTQMTLGRMIERLKELPADMEIGLSRPHSYREYYCDLAFRPEATTVGQLLAECVAAMGNTFEGYKGGEFLMGKNTPVWCAHWGSCGHPIVDISDAGYVVTTQS